MEIKNALDLLLERFDTIRSRVIRLGILDPP